MLTATDHCRSCLAPLPDRPAGLGGRPRLYCSTTCKRAHFYFERADLFPGLTPRAHPAV